MPQFLHSACALSALSLALACTPSVQQEVQTGNEAAAEVERTMPVIHDGTVVSALNSSVAPLKRVARRQDLDWSFAVINSDQVNAFALPGGHIYVFRGLIERADHWDEFAGAVAHEIGHVDLRHSAEQMGQVGAANTGLTLAYVLLGRQPSDVEALAVNLAGGAIFAKFSRDDEREADSMAVVYTTEANIDPEGLKREFQTLETLQQQEPSKVELWFSSHPATSERLGNVDRYIEEVPGATAATRSGRSDLSAYNSLRDRLRAMPPAPKEVQQQ
jgi:predicted Zn-dependent protease